MRQSDAIPISTITNFYLNLINIMPYIILIITGIVLQFNYHLHRLPDDYVVAGLSKSGWLLLHKLSAAVSLAGIMAHCILHRKFIATTTRRIINKRSFSKVISSYYLLIICVPTSLMAMVSWIFLSREHAARVALVEIHDKLALILIIFSAAHIISRFGWMLRTGQKIIR